MVKAATLEVEIGAKIDQFEKSLGKVRKDLGGMEKRLTGVSRGANRAGSAFAGMAKRMIAIGAVYFGARGIFRMAKSFLDVASSIETYKLRLEAMLGSQEAATRAMAFFKDVAAKVPFTLEEVIESGVKVQAFGADLKKWTPILADLAAYMGEKMPEAASALGRAFADGAGAADVFREKGILQVIRDFAKMEKGIDDITKLSLPEFRDVMYEAFAGAESKIAGTADKLATTWTGIISMLQDKWFKFRDAVMKTKVFELMKKGLVIFNTKLDEFVESGKLEKWAEDMAIGVLDGFRIIIEGVKWVATSFGLLKETIYDVASIAIGFLRKELIKLAAGLDILSHLPLIGKKVKGMFDTVMMTIVELTTDELKYNKSAQETNDRVANLIAGFDTWTNKIKTAQTEIKNLKDKEEDLNTKTKEFGETITTALAPAIDLGAAFEFPAFTLGEQKFKDFAEFLKTWTAEQKEKWQKSWEGMLYYAAEFANQLNNIFGQLGANRMQQIDNEYQRQREAIENSLASEEDKAAMIEKLDKKTEKERKKAMRSQAVAAKATNFMAAVVNTARAITEALPNIPLSIIVGGLGAVQAATILAAPLPSYKEGGFVPQETFAHLHAGERVLSASEVRRGAGVGMPAPVINNYITQNISAMDALGVRDFMRNRGIEEIVAGIRAGIQKPELKEALGVG